MPMNPKYGQRLKDAFAEHAEHTATCDACQHALSATAFMLDRLAIVSTDVIQDCLDTHREMVAGGVAQDERATLLTDILQDAFRSELDRRRQQPQQQQPERN